MIEGYGLLNENMKKPGREGIPHPTTIVIDEKGVIRFRETWVDFRKRTSPATIIQELDKLDD